MIERRIGTGLVAGLIAGIFFTLLAALFKTTMPDGEPTSMLIVTTEAVHSHGWVAGWIASLVYTVIIGGIFGWLVRSEPPTEPRMTVWGVLYGVAWWIVSGLILIPVLLAKVPLSHAAVAAMKPVALASLIEHLVYGVILGIVFAMLTTYDDRQHHTVSHRPA